MNISAQGQPSNPCYLARHNCCLCALGCTRALHPYTTCTGIVSRIASTNQVLTYPWLTCAASDPVRAMHSFRDNRTTLLLCTPNASRGLDLPAVSHVYNLGLPQDATQYLHRAGRAGRIGSTLGAA